MSLPTHLESYTGGDRELSASGATLDEVLRDLDARFPGLRFRIVDEQDRIRPHIKLFVGQEMARSLSDAVSADDHVTVTAALSGG